MLAQQGLAQHHSIERSDVGAHRQSVDRRSLDHAQVAQARHCHLQGPRYRRRGQSQHVDVGLKRLQHGDAVGPLDLVVGDDQVEAAGAEDRGELVGVADLTERRTGEGLVQFPGRQRAVVGAVIDDDEEAEQ